MEVLLSHVPNPDIREGGYWSYIYRPKSKKVSVATLQDASKRCCEFIEEYDLGGGNWSGGQVFDEKGNEVAYISYNGRIWGKNEEEICQTH